MRFIPNWNIRRYDDKATKQSKTVEGTVSRVDHRHKNFTVDFPCGGTMQKETFKFYEVGKTVFEIGVVEHG